MKERKVTDKRGRKPAKRAQSTALPTLIAAVSLLGTSLGVAATSVEPEHPMNKQSPEHERFRVAAQTSKQQKSETLTTNQKKVDPVESNQIKGNSLKSNQWKYKTGDPAQGHRSGK